MTGDIEKLDQLATIIIWFVAIFGVFGAIILFYCAVWGLIFLYRLARICTIKLLDFLTGTPEERLIKKWQVFQLAIENNQDKKRPLIQG